MPKELADYYASIGTYPGKYCASCGSAGNACDEIFPGRRGPKSGYVGKNFRSADIKLLFLSSDPGSISDDELERLTPELVQKDVEAYTPDKWKNNIHWYGTHLLALALLRNFDESLQSIYSDLLSKHSACRARGRTKMQLARVTPYFSHVNSVKCCGDGSQGRAEVHPDMARNCRPTIPGELVHFSPDIVISQGERAAECFPTAESLPYGGWTSIIIDGREVLWIKTHHPRYGRFWTEGGQDWTSYQKAAVHFIRETRRAKAS